VTSGLTYLGWCRGGRVVESDGERAGLRRTDVAEVELSRRTVHALAGSRRYLHYV